MIEITYAYVISTIVAWLSISATYYFFDKKKEAEQYLFGVFSVSGFCLVAYFMGPQ